MNASVIDALAAALKGTGLMAKLAPDGETVVIRPRSGSASSDAHTLADSGGIVAGRVTDSASGQGLVGATVKVQGGNLSAITFRQRPFHVEGCAHLVSRYSRSDCSASSQQYMR